uniref:SAE2 domain-containing protein n=1 Tax=Rhabditophanes sp. KR3021 TaxID=114890 RepID=A0AC35TXL9_9BILA
MDFKGDDIEYLGAANLADEIQYLGTTRTQEGAGPPASRKRKIVIDGNTKTERTTLKYNDKKGILEANKNSVFYDHLENGSIPTGSNFRPSQLTKNFIPRDNFTRSLQRSGFRAAYDKAALNPLRDYKKVDEAKATKAIRGKACRSTLEGFDCECCRDYYNALDLSTPEKKERINKVSRHRGIMFNVTKTPPGYWDKDYMSESEQKRNGLLVVSNSPFFLKNKPTSRRFIFKDDSDEEGKPGKLLISLLNDATETTNNKPTPRRLTFKGDSDEEGKPGKLQISLLNDATETTNPPSIHSLKENEDNLGNLKRKKKMASSTKARIEELKTALESRYKTMENLSKDRDTFVNKRTQLETQLTENKMVEKEFALLEGDAKVFKLIGPALVKQDLDESKQNVQKRLEYINGEIKRVEKALEELPEKLKNEQDEISKLQVMVQAVMASAGAK